MKNPFVYTEVVGPEAFCNRKTELKDLCRAAENAEHLFIYAERRVGKTSLLKRVFDLLPKNSFLPVYIDLWTTDSTETFATIMARALTEAAATKTGKLLEIAKSLFHNLSPTITLDTSGNPSVQFGVRPGTIQGPQIEEVLRAPATIATREKRQVVIVFDEFQQLLNYGDDSVERQLRSIIQHQRGVSYFFLGSRKHLIQEMFLDRNRPLFRSAGHYPIGSIETKHWKPFIQNRFTDTGRQINGDLITAMCTMTEGHPFYTQHLAHVLWDNTEPGSVVSAEMISEASELLLRREAYVYGVLWESLTRNQQRFIRGIASELSGTRPFASEFVQTYGLGSPSNAQRAANSLLQRDMIDVENGTYIIVDRFFRLWIKQM